MVLFDEEFGIDEPGPVVAWAFESGDVGFDFSEHRLADAGGVGIVLAEDRIHLGSEFELADAVVVIGQGHGGLFGELGARDAFLGADEELFAGGSGVFEAHAEESAFEPVDVVDADVVFMFDGFEKVRRGRIVSDDSFEVEECFVFAPAIEPGDTSEVVGLGDEVVAGAFVFVEPLREDFLGFLGVALGDVPGSVGHDGSIGTRLGGSFLGPLPGLFEGELGRLGKG